MESLIFRLFVFLAVVASVKGQVTDSPDQLAIRLEEACRSKDKERITQLFHWSGVDDVVKNQIERMIDAHLLQRQITSTKVLPRPEGFRTQYTAGTNVFTYNLPIQGLIQVSFQSNGYIKIPFARMESRFVFASQVKTPLSENVSLVPITISILGYHPNITNLPSFRGSYTYFSGASTVTQLFSGTGNLSESFSGVHVNSLEITNSSPGGWIEVQISEAGITTHKSRQIKDEPYRYTRNH